MKKRVYLETTIMSYLTARPSRDLIHAARQEITREWWESRWPDFDLYVSQVVIDEAARGDVTAAKRRLQLLGDLPRLEITPESRELSRSLLTKHALPEKAVEDAVHIAIASVHGMDFLLTWNCSHIANAEMAPAIRSAIIDQGYEPPFICTPEEMMGDWE